MKTILIDKKEIIIINAALLMEHYLLRNLYIYRIRRERYAHPRFQKLYP